MLLLPTASIALLLLSHFASLFSRPTWRHVPTLVVEAILAPGRRMGSSALRAVGLAHLPTFQTITASSIAPSGRAGGPVVS
ncbi:MAG TPA: hypothetical protein VGP82_15790 [Ktedonobacterales bacterium]|jgi:hypothetical protein|nr:hypothetical protein [Ktedonobacterales bacterium]